MKKCTILCVVSTAILLVSCGEAKQDINRNPPATPSAQQESTSSLNKADTGSALSETSSGSEETASGILSASGSSDESVPSDSTGSSVSGSSTIQVSDSTISDVLGTEDSSGILLAFQEMYSNKDPEVQKSMTLSIILFKEWKYFKGSVVFGTRTIDNVYAVKKDSTWKILSFGEANPSCKWLSSLPADMTTDCLAEGSGSTLEGSTQSGTIQ